MGLTIVREPQDDSVLDGHPMKEKILSCTDPSYLEGVRKAEHHFGNSEVADFIRNRIEGLKGTGED